MIENLQLLAELFRDEPGLGKYQLGVRYIAIPDRLETYVSYGNRLSGPSDEWRSFLAFACRRRRFCPD